MFAPGSFGHLVSLNRNRNHKHPDRNEKAMTPRHSAASTSKQASHQGDNCLRSQALRGSNRSILPGISWYREPTGLIAYGSEDRNCGDSNMF